MSAVTGDRVAITINGEHEVPMAQALGSVLRERYRQIEKWGVQHHADEIPFSSMVKPQQHRAFSPDYYEAQAQQWKDANDARVKDDLVAWDGILLEEVFEALAESDQAKLREELVQVAAVAVAWIEDLDSRG